MAGAGQLGEPMHCCTQSISGSALLALQLLAGSYDRLLLLLPFLPPLPPAQHTASCCARLVIF
jgi:hypothetical protein